MIVISKHAEDRARERLGIPRRSVHRTAALAVERGEIITKVKKGQACIRWAGHVFVFDHCRRGTDNLVLVSVMPARKRRDLSAAMDAAEDAYFDRRAKRQELARRHRTQNRRSYSVGVTA